MGHRCAPALLLSGLLLLAGCQGDYDETQPLSAIDVRRYLGGHEFSGTLDGERVLAQFWRNGVLKVIGREAEFGRWRTGENGALCLRWGEWPERCAPLYQLNVSHYRWAEDALSQLDTEPYPGAYPGGYPGLPRGYPGTILRH